MNNAHIRKLGFLAAALMSAAAVLLGAGCGKKNAVKEQGAAAPRPTVIVAKVEQRTVPIYSEFVGQTRADDTVELRARVEGVLQKVFFREGARVKKGQLLFIIDKRPFEASLQSAKALLGKATSDLAQAKQRVDVLKAQAELADAQAVLSRAEQDLNRMSPLAKEKAVTEIE
ncbi:MAG TPA: biotin/lipoyl-binding protein, partial [Pyrinomonadaceae bacterium]|nr:biotin/lipoyl-binding protein [Pyrinomonadaceae bacterium]